MGLRDWLTSTRSTSTELVVREQGGEAVVYEQLRQEQDTNLLLQEQIADLEGALQEGGWNQLSGDGATEFSRDGLRRITALCRLTAIANPLVKRGVGLRIGYVWGLGVSINARAKGDDATQDVNAVVQAFIDDPSNRAAWTGSQAREERERSVATDGNVFVACFTSPLTGRV